MEVDFESGGGGNLKLRDQMLDYPGDIAITKHDRNCGKAVSQAPMKRHS